MNNFHFSHEYSWVYYLANILNMECHTYGVGGASMGDIFYTLKKCKTSYDYYIIFHTDPLRKGIFSNVKFDLSTCKSTKKFIADKKVLSIYWDVKHKIFDFKNLKRQIESAFKILAKLSIFLTELGIITDSKRIQLLKDDSSIYSTVFGIPTDGA